MPVNSRINKAGLSTVQKNQVRRAIKEKASIAVVEATITSAATLGTTAKLVQAGGTGPVLLAFPVKAYKSYLVEAVIYVTHTDNNGSKVGLLGPTASVLKGTYVASNAITGTITDYAAFTTLAAEGAGGGGTANYTKIKCVYRPSADGTLGIAWAESTSHADTISLNVGTYLKVEEVA